MELQINNQTLQYLQARAQSLCGVALERDANGKPTGNKLPLSVAVTQFFKDLVESNTPEGIRARNEFRARCTPQQLAALRMETFNNFIYAPANFWDFFFETVNLLPDERPQESNTTNRQMKVNFVGGDGEPRSALIDRQDVDDIKCLDFLSTDWVRYQKEDIYRGNVADAALATIDLADDWRDTADGQCFTLLSGAFAAFTLTGKKEKRSFNLGRRIKAANLPTTNLLDISATDYFGFAALDQIINFYGRFGGTRTRDIAKPTGRILVPGADITDIKKNLSAAGALLTGVAEDILRQGWFGVNYLGVNWTFMPDATLARGQCFPESTKKPGRVWLKSSMDKQEERDVDGKENMGERRVKKVFGATINSANNRFVCSVVYKTS